MDDRAVAAMERGIGGEERVARRPALGKHVPGLLAEPVVTPQHPAEAVGEPLVVGDDLVDELVARHEPAAAIRNVGDGFVLPQPSIAGVGLDEVRLGERRVHRGRIYQTFGSFSTGRQRRIAGREQGV